MQTKTAIVNIGWAKVGGGVIHHQVRGRAYLLGGLKYALGFGAEEHLRGPQDLPPVAASLGLQRLAGPIESGVPTQKGGALPWALGEQPQQDVHRTCLRRCSTFDICS